MKNKIVLDEIVSVRGNRTDGYINFGIKPDSSKFRIPITIIEGGKEGPTLLVDACTHGDEYEGAEAIIKLEKALETESFAGTFIGVPALNLEAFSFISRSSITDDINLNRIFPGNSETYITHRLANTYMERVVKNVDFVITFHGGGDVLHLEPIIGYLPGDDALSKKTYEMAKAFNVKYTWRMQNLPFNGVTSVTYKELLGIPAILPEVGSHCDRLQNRENNVGICYDGIINVMSHLKMMDEKMVETVEQMDVELHYLHAVNGGIQKLYKRENEIVEEGELLGEITDVFGNKIEELKAPYRGIVIGFWSISVIRPGDWWYLFAKILN
ncbi:MAG TPA: succinylglutamate desuccinylase/aspartoacylase family protein [Patescibacteria group bacterium]|nr:succinylglutamate desuccinylase/aspartoacylase family protein [Patescibacteria group bacterium]